ncbi:hypothetical protein F8178_13080 [Haloechinothrix sp. LS1_15]|nr:hypothetical protein [Haloechinothrix sp. LS1_15]
MPDFSSLWRRATVGELSWIDVNGPTGLPVVPLELDGMPCVALPYAHLAAADGLTGRMVALSVSEADVLGDDAHAAVALGRAEVTHDLEGSTFVAQLLDQEIVKHPPTRLRADGLMARRENWWWVPRVLVTLPEVAETYRLPARSEPRDALLVRDRDGEPRIGVVTAKVWPDTPGERIDIWPKDGNLLEGDGLDVCAYAHRRSPDFERWEPWYRCGALHGETLTIARAEGEPGAGLEPFGIVGRLRNHRAVERDCRSGIAAVEGRAWYAH